MFGLALFLSQQPALLQPQLILYTAGAVIGIGDHGAFVMVCSPAHGACCMSESCKSSTSDDKSLKKSPCTSSKRGCSPGQCLYSLLRLGEVLLAMRGSGCPAPCSTIRQIFWVPWRSKGTWTQSWEMGSRWPCLCQVGVNKMISRGPFQPQSFYVFCHFEEDWTD